MFNFMVVMITPVCFSYIGYKTYIIFAVVNVFIVPVVYFFYPETAYRSLEEMDAIFHKTKSWFGAVSAAKNEPHRYGAKGELLINYEETEEHQVQTERRASMIVIENERRASMAQGHGKRRGSKATIGDKVAVVEKDENPRSSFAGDANGKKDIV